MRSEGCSGHFSQRKPEPGGPRGPEASHSWAGLSTSGLKALEWAVWRQLSLL